MRGAFCIRTRRKVSDSAAQTIAHRRETTYPQELGTHSTIDHTTMRMLKTVVTMAGTQKVNMVQANPIATKRTRGSVWLARRARWLSSSPLCVMCEAEGRITEAKEVDHIIRLEIGGADDESNYQSLCVAHHKAKTKSEVKGSTRRW